VLASEVVQQFSCALAGAAVAKANRCSLQMQMGLCAGLARAAASPGQTLPPLARPPLMLMSSSMPPGRNPHLT
jgi:hypothetical protein